MKIIKSMMSFIKNHKPFIIVLLAALILFMLFIGLFVLSLEREDQSIQNNQNIEAEEKTPEEPEETQVTLLTKPLSFSDYPAEKITDKDWLKTHNLAPIDFSGYEDLSESDKEVIVGYYNSAKGPNFAYRYKVIEMGCGTGCQYFYLVDVITGKLYETKVSTFMGCEYDVKSNLFVAGSPYYIFNVCYKAEVPYAFCGDFPNSATTSRYYLWEDNQMTLLGEYIVLPSFNKQQ